MEDSETKGHGEKFSRLKAQAIAALLSSPTIREAAETVGIADSTLRQWMKDPDFQRDYDAERIHVLEAATSGLAAAAASALRSLQAQMTACFGDARDQIEAAKAIGNWYHRHLALLYQVDRRSDTKGREQAPDDAECRDARETRLADDPGERCAGRSSATTGNETPTPKEATETEKEGPNNEYVTVEEPSSVSPTESEDVHPHINPEQDDEATHTPNTDQGAPGSAQVGAGRRNGDESVAMPEDTPLLRRRILTD